MTPDGCLKGSIQVNKGGEALQRNRFKVMMYSLQILAYVYLCALKTFIE